MGDSWREMGKNLTQRNNEWKFPNLGEGNTHPDPTNLRNNKWEELDIHNKT